MSDTERQINVIKRILNASDEEANSVEFWMNNVREYGIYPFKWLTELDQKTNYTDNGMMQVQGEIANFCRFLSGQKIQSAMEIGVYRGLSSYFICATIYRKNPDLIYYMVDIVDALDNYDLFGEILPCMKKQIPSTSENYKEKEFDFVFIDADHSYIASMHDYINVGRYAKKMVCFHDIYAHEYDHEDGGCVRTWREVCTLTPQFPKMVFSNFPNRWMGIGVVVNTNGEVAAIEEKKDYEKIEEQKEEFLNDLVKYSDIWVYGVRNDSRRMYRALKEHNYSVKGMVISDESEYVEKLAGYPVSKIDNISVDSGTVIIVCYRESLRHIAIENIKNRVDILVVSDMLAEFI